MSLRGLAITLLHYLSCPKFLIENIGDLIRNIVFYWYPGKTGPQTACLCGFCGSELDLWLKFTLEKVVRIWTYGPAEYSWKPTFDFVAGEKGLCNYVGSSLM